MEAIKKRRILVGQKIHTLRKMNNVSQAALSKITKKKQAYISEAENGKRQVDLDFMLDLCEIFKVELGYFDIKRDLQMLQEAEGAS